MDFLIIVHSLLFGLTLFQGLTSLSRISKRLPPGPTPLPIIGNLHLLGAQPHKSLAKLARTHGPITSLKLGQVTTVAIPSSAMAKEVLQKQDLAFSSRSVPDSVRADDHHRYSVVWVPAVSPRRRSLRKIMNSNIIDRCRLTNHFGKALKLFEGLFSERVEQKKQGAVKDDTLDVLLTTCQENPEEIDRIHVEHMCLDLFAAGIDTISNTLEWAMTEILKNPEIMKKAKEELAQIIGRGKAIKETDVDNLPYLQCTIKETLRLHSPIPFLILHGVEQHVELFGYTIPKGSQVFVNVWATEHDSDLWENPLTFKPERF